MPKINLGTFTDGAEPGQPFLADLDVILRSNALAQANSGGGKSRLFRRAIEQTFGHVQQVVVDPEGEFATLREKYDFLLVGDGGETPADVRSAPLLAHRLLEVGVSAVIDLYEVPKDVRPLWVAAFVNALVEAPKKLWRPLLVYVDEAHEFAPEPGHGEGAAEKASRSALTGLVCKGRKRGFGCFAATHRLGKLSKDFAAELKNVLVGQTWIDVDRDRAAGSLGIGKAEKPDFSRRVKTMAPGNFFALGRAFCLESRQVRIGDVVTRHPEPGARQFSPPPPTDKILHLLPQLKDLPREAAAKEESEEALRDELSRLRIRVADLENEVNRVPEEVEVVRAVVPEALREAIRGFAGRVGEVCRRVSTDLEVVLQAEASLLASHLSSEEPASLPERRVPPRAEAQTERTERHERPKTRSPSVGSFGLDRAVLTTGELRVLTAVVQFEPMGGVTREMLTVLLGYKKSSRDTFIKLLKAKGYVVEGEDKILRATPAGREALPDDREGHLPTGARLLAYWRERLPDGERRVLEVAVREYPAPVSREQLDRVTGYKKSSRDTFIKRLKAQRLVTSVGSDVRASPLLFDASPRAETRSSLRFPV